MFDFSRVEPDKAAKLSETLLSINVLAGGFILTSLIWASATAKMIDRKFGNAAVYFAVGGLFTLFGFMHSPLPGDKMFLPWQIGSFDELPRKMVTEFAIAYLVMAVLMFLLGWLTADSQTPIESDEDFEKLL